VNGGKLFKINFMHSLRIHLASVPEGNKQFSADET
jgi:hypothetical protein